MLLELTTESVEEGRAVRRFQSARSDDDARENDRTALPTDRPFTKLSPRINPTRAKNISAVSYFSLEFRFTPRVERIRNELSFSLTPTSQSRGLWDSDRIVRRCLGCQQAVNLIATMSSYKRRVRPTLRAPDCLPDPLHSNRPCRTDCGREAYRRFQSCLYPESCCLDRANQSHDGTTDIL